jgi:tetratricopeptide (TPR) repeat protein/uncharacterized membrane protein YjjP (DUF1212 family)
MSNFKHYLLISAILILIRPNLLSQEEKQSARQLFVEAESFYLFEEYKDALPLYQKIIRVDPDNYNVLYKIGICYLNQKYLKSKSTKYLEQAALHINPDYKINSYKEREAPLEVLFYLGKSYRVNNMLDEAIKNYQRFKNLAKPEEFDIDLVDYEIASCQLAKTMISKPVYYKLHEPDADINSNYAEINAIISGDGKTLVFTRQMQFYDGVFISVKQQNGSWSAPLNLTPDFGLDGNSYTTGISFHGDEIFVYRSDDFDGNIYSSKLKNEKWSKLEKLNDNINTKFWESHASPSPDGQYLYFTSNRSGGYGGLDIYKSHRGKSGLWGTAMNLGPVVNSPLNEDTPFITNEGFSLFFSSQGHSTIGGYDVFISNLQSDGKWGQPKNMGYPFNTTDDDLFFCPSGINSFGYLSLFDNVETKGLSDIFMVEVFNDMIPRTFTINGKIDLSHIDLKSDRNITVNFLKKGTNEIIFQNQLQKDGSFSISAPQGSYNLLIEGENIQPYMQSVSISVAQAESVIALAPIILNDAVSGARPIATVQPVKQVIIAKKEFYAVSDSAPVAIELILPKGANLHVEILQNNYQSGTEEFTSVKKRFTYLYKPKPGENLLKFTATDEDGNISTTEVMVKYFPSEKPAVKTDTLKHSVPEIPAIAAFGLISNGKLHDYLLSLGKEDFSDINALYEFLKKNAEMEGFNIDEINKMFAVYFSQKDLSSFSRELQQVLSFDPLKWNEMKDSSVIPLQLIDRVQKTGIVSETDINKSLIKILKITPENAENLISQLNLYADKKDTSGLNEIKNSTVWDGFEFYKKNTSSENTSNALNLASTTEELEYFYQNLLVASTGQLNNYLTSLNMNDNQIFNSIELVNHLFKNAEKNGYSVDELIKALETASANKLYYLRRWNEILGNNAEGNLKSLLQSLNVESENILTYEDLINHLLKESKFKNYNRENVYNLLINMIGIKDVSEFAKKIRSYNITNINKALNDTTLTYFSSPFELIQYLLASSNTYNFLESDINNLLIRMLLERGLENTGENIYTTGHQKIWKNPKFISTLVLVNILLLAIIVIISMRRKNNREKK